MVMKSCRYKRLMTGCVVLLLAVGVARPQDFSRQTEHKDFQGVMIKGQATGNSGEPSELSINVNGVVFPLTMFPDLSASTDSESGSPEHVCELFRDQINAYTKDPTPTAEFDADCMSVAGQGSLLLLQANPQKYPVPSADEPAFDKWLKARQRQLHVDVSSTDDSQKLYRVK